MQELEKRKFRLQFYAVTVFLDLSYQDICTAVDCSVTKLHNFVYSKRKTINPVMILEISSFMGLDYPSLMAKKIKFKNNEKQKEFVIFMEPSK